LAEKEWEDGKGIRQQPTVKQRITDRSRSAEFQSTRNAANVHQSAWPDDLNSPASSTRQPMSYTSLTGCTAGSQPAEKLTATKRMTQKRGRQKTVSIPQLYLTNKLHTTDNVRENRATAAVRQTNRRTDNGMHPDWQDGGLRKRSTIRHYIVRKLRPADNIDGEQITLQQQRDIVREIVR
jgi:hypothetical protein